MLSSESFSLAGLAVLITEFDVILAVYLNLISISILKGHKMDYILPHTAFSEKHNWVKKKTVLVFSFALNVNSKGK